MSYSQQTDVQQACGGSSRLRDLTDWDNTGAIDVAKMQAAQAEADAEIDSYLNKQKLVPLVAPLPVSIVKMSARLTVYRLRLSRQMLDEPTLLAYERDVKWLEGVARGEITLGIEPQPIEASLRVDAVTDRPSTKDISRKKLMGFS